MKECAECGMTSGHKSWCNTARTPSNTTAGWMAGLSEDPTAIDITEDPRTHHIKGITAHDHIPFDMPFVTEVVPGLWQGGCASGMTLPAHFGHVISLYPWERYATERKRFRTETYIEMIDSMSQSLDQVDAIASWVNACRVQGLAEGDDVLVHCQAGLNRSGLITARALYLNGDFETGAEIVDLLRAQRSPAVLCNPHFEEAVLSWGKVSWEN